MMKQILVPTDFSENAQKAYPFALHIASKTNSGVTFVLAIEQPFDFAARIEEKMSGHTDYAHKRLKDLINELKNNEEFAELEIDYVITQGKTSTAIINKAKELDADLIVMGSKGASAIKKILFGSVSTSVVNYSPVPVMLIPEDSEHYNFDHITFTTEYREQDISLLEWVAEFGATWKSKINVLHVAAEKKFKSEIEFRGFREKVLDIIDYDDLEFTIRYADDLLKGIFENWSKDQLLLVIGRYKMNFFDTFFNLTKVEELTLYSKIPLLIIPAKTKVNH